MISENVKKILAKLENYSIDNNIKHKIGFIMIPLSDGSYISPSVRSKNDENYYCQLTVMDFTSDPVSFGDCGYIKDLTSSEYLLLKDAIETTDEKIREALSNYYLSLL